MKKNKKTVQHGKKAGNSNRKKQATAKSGGKSQAPGSVGKRGKVSKAKKTASSGSRGLTLVRGNDKAESAIKRKLTLFLKKITGRNGRISNLPNNLREEFIEIAENEIRRGQKPDAKKIASDLKKKYFKYTETTFTLDGYYSVINHLRNPIYVNKKILVIDIFFEGLAKSAIRTQIIEDEGEGISNEEINKFVEILYAQELKKSKWVFETQYTEVAVEQTEENNSWFWTIVDKVRETSTIKSPRFMPLITERKQMNWREKNKIPRVIKVDFSQDRSIGGVNMEIWKKAKAQIKKEVEIQLGIKGT